jgi:hypothetical protein
LFRDSDGADATNDHRLQHWAYRLHHLNRNEADRFAAKLGKKRRSIFFLKARKPVWFVPTELRSGIRINVGARQVVDRVQDLTQFADCQNVVDSCASIAYRVGHLQLLMVEK